MDSNYVTSQPSPGNVNLKVADLIDHDTGTWKRDLLATLFQPRDHEAIVNMRLFRLHNEDKLLWKHSKDGRFSVKSAYYFIMETLIGNTHLRVPGEWYNIWRLRVPQKVKLFLWRVIRGCLPTRMKLQGKGVLCPSTCPLCETNMELFGSMVSLLLMKLKPWEFFEHCHGWQIKTSPKL